MINPINYLCDFWWTEVNMVSEEEVLGWRPGSGWTDDMDVYYERMREGAKWCTGHSHRGENFDNSLARRTIALMRTLPQTITPCNNLEPTQAVY